MKESRWALLAGYNAAQKHLEYLIAVSPTGKQRELLTEANIQLMRARREWEQTCERTKSSGST